MGLQVSSDAQLVFFNKVFGVYSSTTNRVKALLGAGITFEVSLYSIRAYSGKTPLSVVQLTTGSTSLIKGTVDQTVTLQNMKLIEQWVAKLYQEQGAPKALPTTAKAVAYRLVLLGATHPLPHLLKLVKAVYTVTGGSVASAKQKVEAAVAGTPIELGVYPSLEAANLAAAPIMAAEGHVQLVPVGPPVVAPLPPQSVAVGPHVAAVLAKPVDKVIDLKDAAALGQKVHGTSTGSVYHTIALTDKVKVAARLYKSGSISIRAEWTDDPKDDLKKLTEAGVQMKANYGSIHFDAQDVPLQRVIGAFLVGTGISWKAAVMNGAELVIGEK